MVIFSKYPQKILTFWTSFSQYHIPNSKKEAGFIVKMQKWASRATVSCSLGHMTLTRHKHTFEIGSVKCPFVSLVLVVNYLGAESMF